MPQQNWTPWIRRAAQLGALGLAVLLVSTMWGLLQFQWNKDRFPQIRYVAPSYRPEVSWSDERPRGWVRLSSLPRAAWLAVIAAEDGGFFKHNGVEWEQSVAKIKSDLSKNQFPRGVSTLNQQIVKNLYFGARPAFARKLQEYVVARHMDASLEKKQILETYLNIAEWGPGVVGIGAAARYYFRKSASSLNDYECAVLANLLPNPRVRGAWIKAGRMPRGLARLVHRTQRRLAATSRLVQAQQRVRRNLASQ